MDTTDANPSPTIEADGCFPFLRKKKSDIDLYTGNGVPIKDIPVGPDIDSEEYLMNYQHRGKAIIFNHNMGDRPGSELDVIKLKTTFEKLEFKVDVFNNLTKSAIKTHLDSVAADSSNKNSDCIVIVVLAHGDPGKIYARDASYEIEMLWTPFYANVCPSLAGKPKLFFIQACRGSNVDDGSTLQQASSRIRRIEVDGGGNRVMYKIPNASDILVSYATTDGYYAWRSPQEGSWFIQSLCKELEANSEKYDLLRMLTNVHRRVGIQYESNVVNKPSMDKKRQASSFHSSLMRLVYLRPKTISKEKFNNLKSTDV